MFFYRPYECAGARMRTRMARAHVRAHTGQENIHSSTGSTQIVCMKGIAVMDVGMDVIPHFPWHGRERPFCTDCTCGSAMASDPASQYQVPLACVRACVRAISQPANTRSVVRAPGGFLDSGRVGSRDLGPSRSSLHGRLARANVSPRSLTIEQLPTTHAGQPSAGGVPVRWSLCLATTPGPSIPARSRPPARGAISAASRTAFHEPPG